MVIGSTYEAPESFFTSYHCMSDYPPPENLSHQDLGPILNKLQLLLDDLPSQLPWKLEAQTQGNHENEHESGQKLAFAIDPQIDIHSRALLDLISVEDVVDQRSTIASA